jgi:hypothetical protein
MNLRERRKRPPTPMFFALSTVIFASCLTAASNGDSSLRTCAELGEGPTNFDYLVLASIADSPRFLAMAGYRALETHHASSRESGADAVDVHSCVSPSRVVPRLSSLGSEPGT